MNSPNLPDWMLSAGREARARFQRAGMALTLGGEPTYVPLEPEGAEWSVAADGPSKLPLAQALARQLQSAVLPHSLNFYCPGKHYPGETNPRWALRLISGKDRSALVPWPQPGALDADPQALLQAIGQRLGVQLQPVKLIDPLNNKRQVWAAPLAQTDQGWSTSPWPLSESQRRLVASEGPPGLRLPLQHLPADVPRQLLTLDWLSDSWGLFLPPLAQPGFESLLAAIAAVLEAGQLAAPQLSGVVPADLENRWTVLGITADPGVLEINLPVCESWQVYANWLLDLEVATAAVGLRSWKLSGDGKQLGTGGGNHLLWGGPTLASNPLFQQPGWLVAVLRTWQHHPCLSYLFSANPVGVASQAPRADAVAGDLLELELALSSLEGLAAGDQRQLIGETLRHLLVDRSGNPHRSEISVDKFWNPGSPGGCQGLIEFRALESLPETPWMAAVALLWSCIGAWLLNPEHRPRKLKHHGHALHDRMLLPSVLWNDLEGLLRQLAEAGLRLDPNLYRQIWNWRCPLLLSWKLGDSGLEVRQALEPWPLLADVPQLGAITSRFVDTSLLRLELLSSGNFCEQYRLRINGRLLQLHQGVAGLRYCQSRLYPCLHPAMPSHLPLQLSIESLGGTVLASFASHGGANGAAEPFKPCEHMAEPLQEPLRSWPPGAICADLRLN